MSMPTSSPKNTPASAVSLRFGVRTSSSRKKTISPMPLKTTAHQLVEFSAAVRSFEAAFTTSTEMTTTMKMPRNSHSSIAMLSNNDGSTNGPSLL